VECYISRMGPLRGLVSSPWKNTFKVLHRYLFTNVVHIGNFVLKGFFLYEIPWFSTKYEMRVVAREIARAQTFAIR
jgi:hypothetical protein